MTQTDHSTLIPIYLEAGRKRVFACTVDWPGWCRSDKAEEAAIDTLLAYAPRYAVVARKIDADFPTRSLAVDVRERVPGNGTTDFGAPGRVPDLDRVDLDRAQAVRLGSLVRASWLAFDDIVAAAPSVLRKGPRGGGRDRDDIVRHVLAAETAYARSFGVRLAEPQPDDGPSLMRHREAIAAALEAGGSSDRGWPVRYACRRMAWHVLDHAWEIEDKSG